jgi:EamA-like transporter family
MILLTVIHNFLSMVLFLKALQQVDATQAALSNYVITFFGVPIAALWLGEKLGAAAPIRGTVTAEHASDYGWSAPAQDARPAAASTRS